MIPKPVNTLIPSLCLAAFGLLAISSAASGSVLLHDTFADGQRGPTGNQNTPESINWMTTLTSDSLQASTGKMWQPQQRIAFGYFTDANTPVNVGLGQTLTLKIDFTMNGALDRAEGIRIGLFNSGGERLTEDNQGNTNDAFTDYTGYATFFNPNQTSGHALRLVSRDNAESQLLANGAYTRLGVNAGGTFALANDVNYTLTFSLENLGNDGVLVNVSIFNADTNTLVSSMNRTDIESMYTSFDTIVLGSFSNSFTGDWTFSSIEVSMIPEPGSISLLGALALVLAVGLSRRRRR